MMQKVSVKQRTMVLLLCVATGLFIIWGCSDVKDPEAGEELTREGSIPEDAVKMTPELDVWPPVTHSSEWDQPVPMEAILIKML